jgi:exodeoxyribonuclease-3
MKKIRIYTWNVNGLRAVLKKGFLEWMHNSGGDAVCLQEIKSTVEQLPEEAVKLEKFHSYFFPAERKGYSGTAVYSKIKPENVINGFGNPRFDSEGRVIFTEFEKFVLVNVYFPNGGRGPERVQYKLDFYDELFFHIEKKYRDRKGIIVTGDYNTAHKDIDVAKPDKWSKISGFLPEERAWIDKLLNLGYVDVFRKYHKDSGLYTFWDPISRARESNTGWRIDYFLVSEDFVKNIVSSEIHPDVFGSDHCPVSIDLKL